MFVNDADERHGLERDKLTERRCQFIRNLTPLWIGKNVLLAIVAVACCWLYLFVVSSNFSSMVYPDELSAFNILLSFGYFKAIIYYWLALLGRFSAIAWLELPFWIAKPLHIWPWYTIVAARAINFVIAVPALALLIRIVLSRVPVLLCLAISALLLAASFTGMGIVTVQNYWLADQAIYFVSFIFYCVVLSLFWRIVRHGLDRWVYFLLLAFLIYLGAHEINLVGGGLMLALFSFCLLWEGQSFGPRRWLREELWPSLVAMARCRVRPIGQSRLAARMSFTRNTSVTQIDIGRHKFSSRFWYHTPPRRLMLLLLVLGIVYAVAALLQIFSPSIKFRGGVWPTQLSLVESLEVGIPAALMPLLELFLGLRGAVLPIFLLGMTLGLLQHNTTSNDRISYRLLLAPLAFALLVSLTAGVLASRIGLASWALGYPDAKLFSLFNDFRLRFLPVRQATYVYQLWYAGFLFAGAHLGLRIAPWFNTRSLRLYVFPATLIFGAWLAYTVAAAPVFTELRSYDSIGALRDMTARLQYLRPPPSFDNKQYVAEIPGWAPVHPGTYPYEDQLQRMFGSAPIVFAPCGVVGAQNECNSMASPVLERRINGRATPLDRVWIKASNGSATLHAGVLVLTGSADTGEPNLATSPIPKSERTLVEVRVEIGTAERRHGENIAVKLVSDDGTASILFDPTNGKVLGHTENGARALDGRSHRVGAYYELTSRFVVAGPAKNFIVRLALKSTAITSRPQAAQMQLEIKKTAVLIVDSGRSVHELVARGAFSPIIRPVQQP